MDNIIELKKDKERIESHLKGGTIIAFTLLVGAAFLWNELVTYMLGSLFFTWVVYLLFKAMRIQRRIELLH